jgi:hypothetical protein
MRSPAFALAIALLAASCGSGEDPNGSAGDVSEAELAARIENVAFAPTPEEAEKAAPRRLGLLEEATLPDEFRTGRSCRLTEGANLILVAAAFGAVANIDGRSARLAHAGPVGPSGGFFEAPDISVSIGLKRPEGAAPGATATRAGVTVGGDDSKPIQRFEASWTCLG